MAKTKLTRVDKAYFISMAVGVVALIGISICVTCNRSPARENSKPKYTITLFADNGNVIRVCHCSGYGTKDGGYVYFTDYNTGKEVEFSGTIEIEEL